MSASPVVLDRLKPRPNPLAPPTPRARPMTTARRPADPPPPEPAEPAERGERGERGDAHQPFRAGELNWGARVVGAGGRDTWGGRKG